MRLVERLGASKNEPGAFPAENELLEAVWPGLVVEENNLQVHVSALRKILGPKVISTVPRRGYRFTAPLEASSGASGPAPAASTTRPASASVR